VNPSIFHVVGISSGIFRLVPTPNGEWKAHAIFTNLEKSARLPGAYRSVQGARTEARHGTWLEQRNRARARGTRPAADCDYLRGSQSQPKYLVVKREARIGELIGELWRKRPGHVDPVIPCTLIPCVSSGRSSADALTRRVTELQ
jgi:hypothetical protein